MELNKPNLKILIVEDNPGDLLLIQDYLEDYFKSGHQEIADNFAKAKNILEQKTNYFDVILLDLSLPDLDGMPLLKSMLALAKATPLVILTGYANMSFSILALERGASDYLLKDELSPNTLYKSVIHNIERKKYIKEIEKSHKKYSELFQLSPQPLIIYHVDTLAIADVNEAACDLYGYSMDEFLQLSLLDIRPKEEILFLKSELENITGTEHFSKTYTGLFKHKKKNGDIFTVEVYNNAASHDNKNIRISLINDVTQKNKHLKEIEGQNEKLNEIAWVQSHIVRAPLARIMGLIDLVLNSEEEISEDEQEVIFKGILESSNELDKIVRDVTQKASTLLKE